MEYRINFLEYKNAESIEKTTFLSVKWSTTFNNYYVYQSTPFDLYRTPDFSEI